MKISVEFHYDSAHRLPNVPAGHKCGRLHGHTYTLTVTVAGLVDDYTGWVVDFADIKAAVEPVIERLDHRDLNDVIDNPTVENQLAWLWTVIDLPLSELSLQEGKSNLATYQGPQ